MDHPVYVYTYIHTYRCIYAMYPCVGIYIIYYIFTYSCMYYLRWEGNGGKKIAGLNNTPTPLPLLCRCAYVNVSRLCSSSLAAVEDHIAGCCNAARTGGYASETNARQNRSTESVEHVNLHIGRDLDERSPIKYALISPRLSPPPHRSPFGYRLFGWV